VHTVTVNMEFSSATVPWSSTCCVSMWFQYLHDFRPKNLKWHLLGTLRICCFLWKCNTFVRFLFHLEANEIENTSSLKKIVVCRPPFTFYTATKSLFGTWSHFIISMTSSTIYRFNAFIFFFFLDFVLFIISLGTKRKSCFLSCKLP
jgi:hypothetical protein